MEDNPKNNPPNNQGPKTPDNASGPEKPASASSTPSFSQPSTVASALSKAAAHSSGADQPAQPAQTAQPQPSAPASAQEIISMPIDRRTFIKWSAVGWTAFAAVMGGYATMFMRFMFPNVLFEPVQFFKAGFPDEYSVGEVSERWKDKFGVWIVRDDEKIFSLSTVCTHLGCTPNWLANEDKFKCPCHGSGFHKTGINFEGPAPRPLERFRIYLADDGQIVVDKTKKYQKEKGEWKDPESFIAV